MKGRPRGAVEARPLVIGNSWYVRLYTSARKTPDGKFVPATSAGKIANDDAGKIIRRQFNFKLGDVKKFTAKSAGLGLAVAQIKADIESAEKLIGLNVETERPNDENDGRTTQAANDGHRAGQRIPENLSRKIKTLCQDRAQTRMGDNRLPHFRVGRALYFTQSALIHWVQKMKKTGGAK